MAIHVHVGDSKQLTYGECAAIALKAREEGKSEDWARSECARRGAARAGASADTAVRYFSQMTLKDLRAKAS